MIPRISSNRLLRSLLPERSAGSGLSVQEADRQLSLDGGGHGLLDTTHFDTVRFPPAPWALEMFKAAANDGDLAYTPYRGNREVLQVCARSVSALMGVEIDPDQNITLTAGTQGALFSTLSALVDEGDIVVLADPEYLFVEKMLRFLGATVVRLGMVESESGPELDLQHLEQVAASGIRLFLTSNPHNPTGAVFSAKSIRGLAGLAKRYDFLVVIDELYCRLVYDDGQFTHLAAEPGMAERTVTLQGGSKTESLTGYRVGVVVGPQPIIDAIVQANAMLCLRAPAYSQHVLKRWLIDDVEFVRVRIGELRAIRDMTVEKLLRVPGLTVRPSAGTAYLWPDVSALGHSDLEVAEILQKSAGVVVSPGYQFGPAGQGHFRICYAREEASWAAALDRMCVALESLCARDVVL